MKTIPPPCPEPEVGPKYWRSLDQLADTPEFRQWLEREFPAGASEFTDPVSRRHFVKIMSASFMLAGLGLTGCRRPEEHILPFVHKPEGYIHGVPQFYATAMPVRDSAIPLVVRSNEGRPTKVEGNAQHPAGIGATDVFAQASILNLYDPDRAMRFVHQGRAVTRGQAFDVLSQIGQQAQGNGGQGMAFVVERSSSPTRQWLEGLLRQTFPQARWCVHEPVDFEIHKHAASIAYGQRLTPQYHFERAQRIVSLDHDFIGQEQENCRWIRGFSSGRRLESPADDINRLYAVEALFTLTGVNSDHRLRVPSSQILPAAARLASDVFRLRGAGGALGADVQRLAAEFVGDEQWIVECAQDIADENLQGRSLILAGHRQPLAVHLIAHALNEILGNVGETVSFIAAAEPGETVSLHELAQALEAEQVAALIVLGGNPAYNAPADVNWAAAQTKAETIVRFGYYEDETSEGATLLIPAAHYLESWGDARTGDGTIVPVQPLIAPLFGGVTEIEVMARLAGLEDTRPHHLVRETFRQLLGNSQEWEEAWKRFLHDGYLENSTLEPVAVQFDIAAASRVLQAASVAPPPDLNSLEVVFHRDHSMDDGRYNNNGWMQEAPDPVTKIVWENVVMISPKTAQDLDLNVTRRRWNRDRDPQDLKHNHLGVGIANDIVRIELNGRSIEAPVWVQPGMADNVIALALGYGRERSGRVGRNAGYNAYRLRPSAALHTAAGAQLTPVGRTVRVVTTQDHGALEGRPHVREANLDQYRKLPDFARKMGLEAHAPNAGPIYAHPYDKYGPEREMPESPRDDRHQVLRSDVHQWGMSIDLNACVGCNACVVACQSENNVPIVGKDQVNRGREMHWLRLDRYYAGTVEDPQTALLPMLCVHCASAPCEMVCPVNATVHDEEGLNVMVYNRCVGTRYCSNNCPWKVRRFNFFDYHKRPLDALYKGPLARKEPLEYDLIKLLMNPEVSVRMRGVMEKCTFCTQRIEEAKAAQKIKAGTSPHYAVPDGTFTTACAQACPADAIVFGNLLDPDSRVSRLKEQQRDYATLGYLDTRPRVTYLARVRNPNPRMPDYHEYPATLRDYADTEGDPFKKVKQPEQSQHPQGHNEKGGR